MFCVLLILSLETSNSSEIRSLVGECLVSQNPLCGFFSALPGSLSSMSLPLSLHAFSQPVSVFFHCFFLLRLPEIRPVMLELRSSFWPHLDRQKQFNIKSWLSPALTQVSSVIFLPQLPSPAKHVFEHIAKRISLFNKNIYFHRRMLSDISACQWLKQALLVVRVRKDYVGTITAVSPLPAWQSTGRIPKLLLSMSHLHSEPSNYRAQV